MNMKFISVLLLVFTTSLTVSCKNTKKQNTAKVTKKSHLAKKSKMIAPKKIIIEARKELQKEEVLPVKKESHEQVAEADSPPEKMPCVIPNGDGVKVLKGDSYGKCMLTSCQPGFFKYKDSCTPVCREDEAFHKGTCNQVIAQCKVGDQEGEKIWDGDRYGPCIDADDFSISANHSVIE